MKKVSPSNFGGESGKLKLARKPRKASSTFYREPEHVPNFKPKGYTPKECANFFMVAGYEPMRKETALISRGWPSGDGSPPPEARESGACLPTPAELIPAAAPFPWEP